jgi:hypothetical protein
MMMTGKKTVSLGSLRIPEQAAEAYNKALAHFHLTRPVFARMCIDALIRQHRAGTQFELPVSFVLGPMREARQAMEKFGVDIPNFANELARDIIQTAASGEKIALPGHIQTEREQQILSAFKKQMT